MGQDTYADVLLSYKIERKYENADIIKKYLNENFDFFLSGEYTNTCFDNNYLDSNELDFDSSIYLKNEFIYNKDKTDLYYIFYIKLYKCYARNISRIKDPCILGTDNDNTDVYEFINNINISIEKFKNVYNNCELKLIYNFKDC
jgi:hypothetical protein